MKYRVYFDDEIDCPACGCENTLAKGGKRYWIKQFSCRSCHTEIHAIYRRHEADINLYTKYIIFYPEAYIGEYIPEELKSKRMVCEWLNRTDQITSDMV